MNVLLVTVLEFKAFYIIATRPECQVRGADVPLVRDFPAGFSPAPSGEVLNFPVLSGIFWKKFPVLEEAAMADEKKGGGVDPNIWIRQPETKPDGGVPGTAPDAGDVPAPKYAALEVLTLRISEEDLEFLRRLERDIMKGRSSGNRKERITKNTIIRAMLGCFRNVGFDKKEVSDEKELRARLMKGLRDSPPKLF